MKHTLLISSIALLLFANFSNAQTKIGIGIKAGLNYSNLSYGSENSSMYSIGQRKFYIILEVMQNLDFQNGLFNLNWFIHNKDKILLLVISMDKKYESII